MSRPLQIGDFVSLEIGANKNHYEIKTISPNITFFDLSGQKIVTFDKNIWQVSNLTELHSLKFLSRDEILPMVTRNVTFNVPIKTWPGQISDIHKRIKDGKIFNLDLAGDKIQIQKYLDVGREAFVYEGLFNDNVSVYRIPKRCEKEPKFDYLQTINEFLPIIYIIFEDSDRCEIKVMEKLLKPIYSTIFFNKSIKFLHELKKNNIIHGDLSPSNIMMNKAGDPIFIDFSPSSLGTPFYGHHDPKALGLSLLNFKNQHITKSHNDHLHRMIDELKNKLPEPKETYFDYLIDLNGHQSRILKTTENSPTVKLEELFIIFTIYQKIKKIIDLFPKYNPSIEELTKIFPKGDTALFREQLDGFRITEDVFINYLASIFPNDEENTQLFDLIR